ncbi:MAG: hypothetical protein LLF97_03350 [Planctomycetaceae bacterium]|nr:hypothetical protein [Planctomycetaceae bacterium]
MKSVFYLAAVLLGLSAAMTWAADDRPKKEVAATTPRAAERGDPIQKLLDRIGKLPPAEQQDWLRRLERRAMRAAELSLSAEDAARQQAKIRDQLHRGLVTWQTLHDVIKATDSSEKEALNQRVRLYRAKVFDAFRHSQKELGERQQAWFDAYLAWKVAGSQFEQQDRLIDWLDQATLAATPNAIEPLPKAPKFESEQTAEAPSRDKVESDKTTQKTVERTASQEKKTPPTSRAPRLSNASPTEKPLMAGGEVATGAVEIKVDELDARVSGFNLALRGLESDLEEKGAWDAERLGSTLDQLKLLAVRRNDLRLFRDALPKGQRASVDKIESLKSAVSSMNARIAEVRAYLKGPEFNGTDDDRQDALERLDLLSRQLVKIAEKQ